MTMYALCARARASFGLCIQVLTSVQRYNSSNTQKCYTSFPRHSLSRILLQINTHRYAHVISILFIKWSVSPPVLVHARRVTRACLNSQTLCDVSRPREKKKSESTIKRTKYCLAIKKRKRLCIIVANKLYPAQTLSLYFLKFLRKNLFIRFTVDYSFTKAYSVKEKKIKFNQMKVDDPGRSFPSESKLCGGNVKMCQSIFK